METLLSKRMMNYPPAKCSGMMRFVKNERFLRRNLRGLQLKRTSLLATAFFT